MKFVDMSSDVGLWMDVEEFVIAKGARRPCLLLLGARCGSN